MPESNINSYFVNIPIEMGNLEINYILPNKYLEGKETLIYLPHTHAWCELHIVYEGSIQIATDTTVFNLGKNAICVIPSNYSHSMEKRSHDAQSINMLLNLSLSKKQTGEHKEYEYYDDLYKSIKDIIILNNSSIIEKYFTNFLDIFKENKISSVHVIKCLLLLSFIDISENIAEKTRMEYSKSDVIVELKHECETDTRILEIENYISQNFQKNIMLSDVANHISLSETHTARLIKNQMGLPFYKLLLNMRMKYAKNLVLSSELPLIKISEKIGYNSYNGFYTKFNSYYGVSPNKMREDKTSVTDL